MKSLGNIHFECKNINVCIKNCEIFLFVQNVKSSNVHFNCMDYCVFRLVHWTSDLTV